MQAPALQNSPVSQRWSQPPQCSSLSDSTAQLVPHMVAPVAQPHTEPAAPTSPLQVAPPEQVVHRNDPDLLNGPVVDPTSRTDVVANQGEVDDLLASLGF